MAHDKFSTIINTINDEIDFIGNDIESVGRYFNSWHTKTSKPGGRVFGRKTALSLQAMTWLIISRIVQSLSVRLDSFFGSLDLPVPTKSAFSMKRTLIRSEYFSHINDCVVKKFYTMPQIKTWKGYVLLACDGSRLGLPDVEELGSSFGYYHTNKGVRLYPSAKAAIFQDTLNNITVLGEIENKDKDERYTFEERFEEANELAGGRSIMLVDRGYFSYLLMYLMNKKNQFFVMKCRTTPWSRKFIESGKKESVEDIIPSGATSVYSQREWRISKKKTITVRLVRFDHPDGNTDVLVTNIMDRHMATAKDIISLYRFRWPAETSYGVYKNDMAIELFSSFRIDGVRQDFYAALILYNMAAILAFDTDRHRPEYKPDMNVMVGLVHNLCPPLALEKNPGMLKRRIAITLLYAAKCLSTVKPNRSYPRERRTRKINGKFYRHTNYAIAV